ncbi:hypothetical protein HDR60_01770 [bacterium]|nr:hypothetical protein [bacterium]
MFDIYEETGRYKKRLKDSYDNKDNIEISREDFFDFGKALIETNNEKLINNISKLSAILNRQKNDSFYIPYALFLYHKKQLCEVGFQPNKVLNKIEEKKLQSLSDSIFILKRQIKNKVFIDNIYKKIRTGEDIGIVYNPKRIKQKLKEINTQKRITHIVNNMFIDKLNVS